MLQCNISHWYNFFRAKINFEAQFFLHNFHPFFHSIIGTSVLKALNATIDFSNGFLTLQKRCEKLIVPISQYCPGNVEPSSKLTFRTTHLNQSEKDKLEHILNSNKEVFHEPDSKLTCATRVECSINTTDDIPVHQRVYPYPAAYTDEVNNQIEKFLVHGIIRPSRSPWTSPVWVVPKKLMLQV